MTMLEQVFNKTIEEYGLIKPQDKVLIAVSGGTDSTALLFLLNSLKGKYKLDLHVAHLNHMIRKGDSELDVRYVQNLCDTLKIPITVEAFDVQAFAKEKKMGLEAAARQVRYAFLHRLAEHIGADKIAVGHTADDNVETFLMRLLRGAGLKGLCGIPVRRGKIVRPMIKLWRRDLEDYVGYLKLVPRRDYTNYESHYTRNRVRMKLLPQLRLYNLNIKEIILQTVLLLTEDKEFIDDQAQIALHSMIMEQNEDTIVLEIGQLKKMSSTIQSHVIRLAIKEIKGDLTDLSFTNIHDIIKLLDNSEKWELHLPGGIFANGYRGRLSITHQRIEEQKPRSYRYALKIPGEVELKEISRRLKAEFMDDFNLDLIGKNSGPQTAFIDAASLGRELVIRSKEDGDRFMPYGMKGTKKLQDIFVDAKIPFELRDSLPVVESHSKIVWVAGLRIDDRAKVTKASKKIIRLELL